MLNSYLINLINLTNFAVKLLLKIIHIYIYTSFSYILTFSGPPLARKIH